MKKILIYIVVVILGILILVIILGDFMSNERAKSTANPYAYKVDEYMSVDPSLIKYEEIKRIGLDLANPKSIDVYNNLIVLGYINHLQVIDTVGIEIFKKEIAGPVSSISVSPEGNIFLGCFNYIEVFDLEGNPVEKWEDFEEDAIITSIAFKGSIVYVADAGNQKVLVFNDQGQLQHTFDGTGRLEGDYGFIIPSPYFDLEVDPEDQLWVVNPGILNVENYTDEGTLRAFWGKPSFDIDGFIGCCNPAHFAIFPDGSFVTSEKGLSRIKVYKASGELDGVVSAPKNFKEESEPSDIAVDASGRIYALDIAKDRVRIFQRK
jgi:DNA-binding beta-propeller fold protein YncE